MPTPIDDALAAEMATWEAGGLRRRLAPLEGRLDFVSSDYLGLSRHPDVISAARAALAEHGAGGRASRLLGGGSPLDARAEDAARDWLRADAALLFPTGYQANLGVVTSLAGARDTILSDRLNHASIIDGARLSRARVRVFGHANLASLERELAAARGSRRRLVITEGVFSMDGDSPDLAGIAELCLEHDAALIVDEAHAAGLVGPEGAGAWAAADVRGPAADVLLARIVTGGKALGTMGAVVAGGRGVREHLVNHARSFVYTTAAMPAVAGAFAAAVGAARGADEARARVLGHARALARELGLPAPAAAIVPFPVGDDARAMEFARRLAHDGFEVRAVRPPTVPRGTARLRIVCHADHNADEIRWLAAALERARAAHPAPPASTTSSSPAPRTTLTPLAVVGTDTGVGKTVVSALLARAAARAGAARYWKPVQTGDESDTAEVARLAGDAGATCHEPGERFALPASPHEAARAEGRSVDVDHLDRLLAQHRGEEADGTLVVELAGGLLVPLTPEFMQADWLERHRPDLVLVARSGLGTLNHTLLTIEALASRGLVPRALFLVGEPHASNRETLATRLDFPLFEVTHLERLEPAALDAWLDAHDVRAVLGSPHEPRTQDPSDD